MSLQVKEVSEIAGVSVRTLHHYDAIGLLVPSSITLAVDDERFTANIDKHQPGLAPFMKEAMHIYCDRMQAEQQQ